MVISIVIPMYNEEETIGEVLKRISAVTFRDDSFKKEVIVVDDGSTDNSAEKVREFENIRLISHPRNFGKGAALKTGIKYISGDIVIIQDGDLEYNPNEFQNLIDPILSGEADVVYGSRFLETWYPQNMHPTRFLFNRLISALVFILFGKRITDEATCYKVFKAGELKKIRLNCVRFEFCPEVTAKCIKRNLVISEVPITYSARSKKEGKKIKWFDGVEAVFTLIRYRFFD